MLVNGGIGRLDLPLSGIDVALSARQIPPLFAFLLQERCFTICWCMSPDLDKERAQLAPAAGASLPGDE